MAKSSQAAAISIPVDNACAAMSERVSSTRHKLVIRTMAKKKLWKAKLKNGFQPVMIDMDVHKAIEGARQSFSEMPNAILRRLLGLEGGPAPTNGAHGRAKSGGAAEGGWSKIDRNGRAVFLPDGTELRAAYCGRTVTGAIRAGAWEVGESRFNSPSAALIANVQTREGRPVNLNGWRHWEVKSPGASAWRRLADL